MSEEAVHEVGEAIPDTSAENNTSLLSDENMTPSADAAALNETDLSLTSELNSAPIENDKVVEPDDDKVEPMDDSMVEEEAMVDESTAAVVEDSTVDETAIEESAMEESTVEETAVEESAVEETAVEESAVEESAVEESAVEESAVEESAVEESVVEEASKEDTHQFTAPNVPCFEEDTRSSWAVDSSKNYPDTTFNESVVDEDSQASFNSQQTKREDEDESSPTKKESIFPVENLFEYQWPQEKGDFYYLQEQISDFLGVKSFKRKYPDLQRRLVELDEKEFLKERGVVSEMQCDLGLTALKSEEVMDLMIKDYPEKYNEYVSVLQEKERQSIKDKHKEYATPTIDKGKMEEYVKKASHSAAEYNAHLNHERKEERKACFDLQTFTILYPTNKRRKLDLHPKMGKFPVALLPGQYQDFYRGYTPQELKYLPINTVLYGPPQELGTVLSQVDSDNASDSEESSASEDSSSSSQDSEESDSSSESSEMHSNNRSQSPKVNYVPPDSNYRPKHKPHSLCRVCEHGDGRTREGRAENLVHCNLCEHSGHPTCLSMTAEVASMVFSYPWQCPDCKICAQCMDPTIEDKIVTCDHCDRGYHHSCVRPTTTNRWICKYCAFCALCNSKTPTQDGSKGNWLVDSLKVGDGVRRPHVVCVQCARQRRFVK